MDKKTTIAIVVGIALVLVIIGGQGILNNFMSKGAALDTNTTTTTMQQDQSNTNAQAAIPAVNPNQVQAQDVTVGTGAVAAAGNQVTVNYVGMFQDGKKFDSSYDRGTPFTFTLGAGQVIKGWDIGVAGMKVGGKRILVIPSALGYGAQAVGPIPANSTLVFQVELLGVK